MTTATKQREQTSEIVLTIVDNQLQSLPQSELMKVADVADLLLDIRNAVHESEDT